MTKQFINITVATSINGQGGVATVLTGYRESGFFEENHVKILTSHKKGNNVSLFLTYFTCLLKLVWLHIFHNVGVVHIHMASRGSYKRKSLVVRLCKKLGSKVLLHLHGAEFRDFYNNECNVSKKQHIAQTFNLADCLIVLSTQWKEWVDNTFNNSVNVKVVYNAVPQLSLPPKTHTESKNVAFLGRIGERKGVYDLIRCFPAVLEKHPSARLVLAGDGEITEAKKLVDKLNLGAHVELLGWISGEQKLKVLQEASVYCLPSYNEGFPMGVLEAMSAEIPVVSTYAGGIPDAITNGVDGLLVEAGDVEALSKDLLSLLDSEELASKLTKSALLKFEKNFSFQAIKPQLENIYSELLETK